MIINKATYIFIISFYNCIKSKEATIRLIVNTILFNTVLYIYIIYFHKAYNLCNHFQTSEHRTPLPISQTKWNHIVFS